MTNNNNIHALLHGIFIDCFSILKADQDLIISIGNLTFESDLWY